MLPKHYDIMPIILDVLLKKESALLIKTQTMQFIIAFVGLVSFVMFESLGKQMDKHNTL